MNYTEEKSFTEKYKQAYVDGIESLISQRQKQAEVKRDEYSEKIFEEQGKFRNDFKKMLGWPLVGYEKAGLPMFETEKLSDEDGYSIYRMKFDVLDGLKMTGLFFKMEAEEKKPLVIVQHGGQGTPELISGMYGDTFNYNNMLARVIKHGVHAFAPQLLLWADEYNVKYDRQEIDARLKRVGSSITAIEIYGIMKIIDYFEAQDYVSDIGMVGLSYGGFYTLYTAAIDTRIKSAVSCAFFNKRECYPWSDWTWERAAEKFDDVEIACLVYPRKLQIGIGNVDPLFDCKYGVESFEKLKKLCKNVGTDWVDFEAFDGVHEFYKDDNSIEKLINDIVSE